MATLTNLNDVKRALAIATNSSGTLVFDKNLDDTQIQADILAASDLFTFESGQDYDATQGTLTLHATDRYVCGKALFFRKDVLSITRIENDGLGTLTASDWVTMPIDSTPLYGVELKTKNWQFSSSRLGAIRVIGVIGRSAAGQPSPRVHLAVTRLASWLYESRDNQGVVHFADREASVPENWPTLVKDILELERSKRIST